MAATQINLDDAALAEAGKILGTSTKVDTVNSALRAVVARQRQLEMLERVAQDGTFTDSPKGDEAWR